jgi:hypothetical protein
MVTSPTLISEIAWAFCFTRSVPSNNSSAETRLHLLFTVNFSRGTIAGMPLC